MFELPDGWVWTEVRDIAGAERYSCVGGPFGSKLTQADYVDGPGVPVIRGSNLSGGTSFEDGGFVFVSEEKKQAHLLSNLAYPGDLVFTQRGTLGQVGRIPDDSKYPEYVLSQSQMKLAVDPERVDPIFAYAFFRSPYAQDYIERHAITTGVPHINLSILRNFPFPLPPLKEQRAIASIFGALDDRIELNRKMNRTLEEIAQTLFRAWFVDFEGETELVDSELGPVPRGWNAAPIGDLVETVGGTTPRTKEPLFWEGGHIHWSTPKDLSGSEVPLLLDTARKITNAGLKQISSGLLPVGTVLMSSRAPVGYTAIAEVPLAINQGYIAIPPGGRLSNYYVLFWLRENMDRIKNRAGGTTFKEISKRSFRPMLAIKPPADLRENFDLIVEPLMQRIAINERQSRTLAALRDTLLPKLISGEIRVPEAEEAVAEAGALP